MTHEEVMTWILKLTLAAAWIFIILISIVGVGYTSGYLSEKYVQYKPAEKCINSACDLPCKPGGKFQRHIGECK